MLFVSGLRFRHFQRSAFLRYVDSGAVFHCSQGKCRVRGMAAPPFEWALPFTSFTPEVLVRGFVGMAQQLSAAGALFLLPSLVPAGSSIDKATGFSGRAMTSSVFSLVLVHLTSLAPSAWPERRHEPPSSRSTRRTLATVAEVLQLGLQERLPLGSWQEDLSLAPSSSPRSGPQPPRACRSGTLPARRSSGPSSR